MIFAIQNLPNISKKKRLLVKIKPEYFSKIQRNPPNKCHSVLVLKISIRPLKNTPLELNGLYSLIIESLIRIIDEVHVL